MPSEDSSSDFIRCCCGHYQMNHAAYTTGGCRNCACETFRLPPQEEPPLTPEEEEEAGCSEHPDAPVIGGMCGGCTQYPEDMVAAKMPQGAEEPWPCGDCGAIVPAGQGWCTQPDCQEKAKETLAREAPPQPARRPPYAVAYSVGGHPYELNLPGDAEVLAVDGVLIIRHALGPVAGIVQVLPIETKEA